MTYYDLNRRFVERESYDQDELIAAQVRGKLVGWTKVLEKRSSIIVAAAITPVDAREASEPQCFR